MKAYDSGHTRKAPLICIAGAAVLLASPVWPQGGGHGPKVSTSTSSSSSDQPLPTGRGALKQIVQGQCVLNWQQHGNPAPCERVVLTDPRVAESGYAILEDPDGGAHYLLVPTKTMAGLDSSELLDPDAPNYFAEAWRARDFLKGFVGHEVPRTDIGLVVSTAHSRAYDQFHIHIECLRQDVAEALRSISGKITSAWAPVTVTGATFQGMQILGDGLDGSNLFESLAALKPDVSSHMGDYTLVAVGAQFVGGPGFIVLTGTGPSGEFLVDPQCLVAGGGG
jgi:CDP-diacylglycerol pyrophosphatase